MDPASGELESVIAGAAGGRIAGLRPGNILTLEGIRYAKPPVGRLRWRVSSPAPMKAAAAPGGETPEAKLGP